MRRGIALGLLLSSALWPALVWAQAAAPEPPESLTVERQLKEIRAARRDLTQQLGALDSRIEALEAKLESERTEVSKTADPVLLPPPPPRAADSVQAVVDPYQEGKGMVLARGDSGELDFSVFSYVRYLNQNGLADSHTDSFGRTSDLDLRQDVQLQKVMLYFKGWMFDPKFRYLLYVWTTNTSQGQGAQVVVGGNLSYRFSDHLTVGAGIGALPTTRSVNYSFPNWLRVDNRTIADEFFRGSYTSGVWAIGDITRGLKYNVMVGNNLSQLGVDAGQLDAGFNTVSGALMWMPTTGEYGPAQGFGDYEHHQDLATILGVNFTQSREDAEEQPGVNAFENAQIRLSDGTRIFQPGAFDTDGQITKATYRMLAANGGFKYRGLSLDAEYFHRWVDDFKVVGTIPVDKLNDQGYQLQASAMAIPRVLQLYASGSQIFGEYGDSGDLALGLNWYPFKRREARINVQALYLDRSPVGYASYPTPVGGDGWVLTTDFMLNF